MDLAGRPGDAAGLMDDVHPIGEVLSRAAGGDFPAVDGGWRRVEPWRPGVEGVVAFTGHAYLAVDDEISDGTLSALGPDGFGGASNPRLVSRLAGSGWIDALDIVLVARGIGGEPALVPRSDLRNHPRAEHATSVRSDVATYGYAAPDDHTLVTLSTGLGGLLELGLETDPAKEHAGADVVRDALTLVAQDEVVVAACAPGNARALRAFLSAGFEPVASVQLWRPER
ncbi:N-acetyltransferase [Terrabacter sp. NPDC080008]|uniref:N-acetyltransferase n=1 Tax=Terrabacter sp. NPDC080008 TaxID=3155176 RepID=UPI00344F7F80